MNKKLYFILATIIFSNSALKAARPKPSGQGFESIANQEKTRSVVTNLYNNNVLSGLPENAVLNVVNFLYPPVPGSQQPRREEWRSKSLFITPPRNKIQQKAPPAPKRPRLR